MIVAPLFRNACARMYRKSSRTSLLCAISGSDRIRGSRVRAFECHDLMLGFAYHPPHPTSLSPTTRRSNLLISSALCALAAFIAVIVCFKVLVFDPQMTVPPITAASAPIMTVGSNPTAPMLIAKIKAPPAAMATFETRMNFLQLSITSASSSMWASICKTCSRRSPSSSM